MSDYISREAAFKEFAEFVRGSNNSDFLDAPTWNDAVSLIGSLPAADVVEKEKYDRLLENSLIVSSALQKYQKADVVEERVGTWTEKYVDDRTTELNPFMRRRFYCSACGEWNTHGKSRYCPKCGAKMDGEINGEINEVIKPTIDAVPVVRCKDCVYWASGANEDDSWEYCYWFDREIDGNEFCSYGERKDGADNG